MPAPSTPTRRLIVTVFAALAVMSSGYAEDIPPADPDFPLLGIWSTHYQQTFITLIINRDHTAQVVLIDQGHSIGTVPWKPAPNGLIVEGLPRFRLWHGKTNERARAQIEPLRPEWTNDTLLRFPPSFYMRKSHSNQAVLKQLATRPMPAGWNADAPPASFEQDAGRPRLTR